MHSTLTRAQAWAATTMPHFLQNPQLYATICSAIFSRTKELPATVLRRQQQHWFYISAALPANFRCRHFHNTTTCTHYTPSITAFLFCPAHTCSHIHPHTGQQQGRTTNVSCYGCGCIRFGAQWLQATGQMCDRCTSMAARDVQPKTSSSATGEVGIYASWLRTIGCFLGNKYIIINWKATGSFFSNEI